MNLNLTKKIMLYPLKFEPIYKERLWGGSKLRDSYDRLCPEGNIGESWELSGLEGDVSVVSNGTLAGNDLQELIEVYMGELVGDSVYNAFGEEFPLLIKLLDASEILSVQVHPDNELALERHNAYGKTEMWYILEAAPESFIYLGFNRKTNMQEYLEHTDDCTIDTILKKEKVEKGDMFIIPPGTIHAIGKGIVLAEIQQASDITYRVFDWNRTDPAGNSRELHTELAIDAINFSQGDFRIKTDGVKNEYFTTNVLNIDGTLERDYAALDSFVIYLCLEGNVIVECEGGSESLLDTETMLLPAVFDHAELSGKGKLLEIYIDAK